MLLSHLRSLFIATMALMIATGSAALADLADVRQRGALRIGLEGTYPPFNFQDEKGELAGFEVEFAKALAGKLGLQTDFQPNKWDGLLAALETGRTDVVINQVTVTPERTAKYDFTTPYTVSGIQIIVRKGNEDEIKGPKDLAGKSVGVVLGTNYEKWLKENVPEADVRTYDDDATRNQDLRVGRLDAIVNDRLIVPNLLKTFSGQIVAAGEPFARQEQAIAMKKGNPDLLAALNEAIAALRADGTLKQLSEKWFGADVTQ